MNLFTCRGTLQNYGIILFELNLSVLIGYEILKYFASVYYNNFQKVSCHI